MTFRKTLAILAALALPAAAETIEGSVDFTGKPPVAGKLHREADPYCAKKPMNDPAVTVKNGRRANVWGHVAKGAKDRRPPTPPEGMDQKAAMHGPRIRVAAG